MRAQFFRILRKMVASVTIFLMVLPVARAQTGIQLYNTSNSALPDNTVRAILVDRQDDVWVGTDWGLARFDGTNWTVYQVANSGLPDNSVRSLLEDAAGNLWVGMLSGGLARYDGSNWVQYTAANSPLPGDHVRALAEDPAGPIWVGSTSGLAKLADTTWTVFDFLPGGGESNHVAALSCYAPDSLWVGLINGGLLNLRSSNETYFTLANSGLNDNTILGIARDSNADLWLAAPAAAAIQYFSLVFFNYNSFNSGNPSNSMNAVVLDGNEQPWFSTYDQGVVHFDGTNWKHYDPANSAVPEDFLHAVAYDSARGLIWGGCASQGLLSLQPGVVTQVAAARTQEAVRVFPNPVTDQLRVTGASGAKGQLILRDLQGRTRAVHNGSWDMPITVPAGIYFLEILHEGGRKVVRLQVK